MLDLGLIGFAQPLVLLALLALPALWWLMRLIPPPPRRARFPAIALLAGLVAREESAARMPWWLLALRLLIAAAVILALADPVLAPQQTLQGKGPVVVVVDNGWASAHDWPARQQTLANILDEADRAERPVLLLPTAAAGPAVEPASIRPAAQVRAEAGALAPSPWRVDRDKARQRLPPLQGSGEAVWLSDGIESAGRAALAEQLQRLGRLQVFSPAGAPLILAEPEATGTGLRISVSRPAATAPAQFRVQAVAEDGRLLASSDIALGSDARASSQDWVLPRDVINRTQSLRIAGTAGAASTVLLDERWQRRLVGIVDDSGERAGHPLLDSRHYLQAALTGLASFRHDPLGALLEAQPNLLVTRSRLTPDAGLAARLEAWLIKGGVLLRFAGSGLAENPDEWLPVQLRSTSRALGGALSWETPQLLAPFPEASPFAGLTPPDDVTVSRQVLAEPAPDLRDKTWASLADGTPLVTAEKRGEGWLVLVHVGADADWSSLTLSGLFLEMLDRLVRLGHGQAQVDAADQPLQPQAVLDGFGQLSEPTPQVQPLPPRPDPSTLDIGPQHPPGYYGSANRRFAWNLAPVLTANPPVPIRDWQSGVIERGYETEQSRDIGAWLLLTAIVLLLADTVASLLLRGHLPGRRGLSASLILLIAGLTSFQPQPVLASDELALQATLATRLAFVETGDADVDRASAAGLAGLSQVLAARTSIEPEAPIPVDIETTELAFFPLLYWPVLPGQPLLTAQGRQRVSDYMARGGTILFDTRDQDIGGEVGPGGLRLRQLLDGIRIPPLEPVPGDHVLTRAFYLIDQFPGRWDGAPVWIESKAAAARDGVTSIVIGRHDWAAAWALGPDWRPLYPVYPGGPRQRELAYRFGVNLVMHVLTGNYKSDQVHIPDILQRLGQ